MGLFIFIQSSHCDGRHFQFDDPKFLFAEQTPKDAADDSKYDYALSEFGTAAMVSRGVGCDIFNRRRIGNRRRSGRRAAPSATPGRSKMAKLWSRVQAEKRDSCADPAWWR